MLFLLWPAFRSKRSALAPCDAETFSTFYTERERERKLRGIDRNIGQIATLWQRHPAPD
jgi:hypothetical protein